VTQSAPPVGGTLAGRNVLVIEDEVVVYFLVEDMLSELGCSQIRHASSVDQALGMLGEAAPDVALLDVNLAGRSARPVAERLAASGIPFVFATGYGNNELTRQFASPVLQKPFDIDRLALSLAEAMAK
jgi:CheY-like chemotaxis protein